MRAVVLKLALVAAATKNSSTHKKTKWGSLIILCTFVALLYHFELRPLRCTAFPNLIFDDDLERVLAGRQRWSKLQPRTGGDSL